LISSDDAFLLLKNSCNALKLLFAMYCTMGWSPFCRKCWFFVPCCP